MKNLRDLPKLRDSLSFLYLEHARIEQDQQSISSFDAKGETQIPAAALGVLMLGPGTSITHAAMKTLAENGCTVLWVAEGSARFYAQGQGETRSSARILRQAAMHADPAMRAAVVLRMYEYRFGEVFPTGLTIEQIRGKEGVRVRTAYEQASKQYGVPWHGRQYERGSWYNTDPINRAISCAAACLNGICHCAVVSVGYSTALGFIHTGKQLSFVYDISDLYRIELVVPVAFDVASRHQTPERSGGMEREIRTAFREIMRERRHLERIVDDLDHLFDLSESDIERSAALIDGRDNPPGGLWDPETGEITGGVNYGPDDPGASVT